MGNLLKILFILLAAIIVAKVSLYGYGRYAQFRQEQEQKQTASRLQNVAEELPRFNGHSISNGTVIHEMDCYAVEDVVLCPGIQHKQNLEQETGWKRVSKFVEATRDKGVTWREKDTEKFGYKNSDVFERDDKQYQLVLHGPAASAKGKFQIVLLEY